MPKEMDIIKINTLKRYINDVKFARISSTAANELRVRFNAILKKIITDGLSAAREDDRSTIMPRDITPAIEETFGKKALSAPDIMKSIKKLNPIALGELSKLITSYIEEEKHKKT